MAEADHPDPWAVLGVAQDAGDEAIRAAYLGALKEHPPDADPEGFERVRDAWEVLRDPCRRTARVLLAADPEAPLESLLDERRPPRRFLGPEPWLAAIREGGR